MISLVIQCPKCGQWRMVQITYAYALIKYTFKCFGCKKSSKVYNRGIKVLKVRGPMEGQEATRLCQYLNGRRKK